MNPQWTLVVYHWNNWEKQFAIFRFIWAFNLHIKKNRNTWNGLLRNTLQMNAEHIYIIRFPLNYCYEKQQLSPKKSSLKHHLNKKVKLSFSLSACIFYT